MRIITLFLFLVSLNILSQEKKNSDLEKLKKDLTTEIIKLNDSLKKIEKEIVRLNYLETKTLVKDSSLVSIARKGAYLKKSSEVYSDIILKLKEKKEVVLLDYLNGYFGVCTDSICGYMNEMWIEKNIKINKFIKGKEQEQNELRILKEQEQNELRILKEQEQNELRILKEQKRIQDYAKLELQKQKELKKQKEEYDKLEKIYIQKYGNTTYKKLKKGMYWLGMKKEMAKIALGNPSSINRSIGSWGVHEQWVYYKIYLYFENGKLTSYQN